MKIKVVSRGGTEFDADAEYVEPMVREAIADSHPNIAAAIIDCTDTERDHDHDEHVTVTEDDGTVLWSGWLDGRDEPGPEDPAAIAASYEREIGRSRERATMLLADLEDAEARLAKWPRCPAGCSCRVGVEDDADRNECSCDGPCTARGDAGTDRESDKARADRLQQACITLGRTFDHLTDSMYAARIEIWRGDHKAACEWVLNAMEDMGPDEPGAGWDGTETAQDWYDRTRAAVEFNGGKPVRIVSRPGPDITIGALVMAASPGRADVVCAVPVPGGICGKPLTEGPCVIDHGRTEVDGQESLFDTDGDDQ